MKSIKKIFNKKIFYSCVVDDHPKFYWQGYIFVTILKKIAKVKGERIFIHLTKKNIPFEKFLKENGVNFKYIEPWGDKKYCNKLQQLETKELQNADFVFFCDADIAILEDLSKLSKRNHNKILAKIVDGPNPSIDKLKDIYQIFGIKIPKISKDTLFSKETFEVNFNGGLYGIPSKVMPELIETWKKFATKILDSNDIINIFGDKTAHIDQVSFSMALTYLNLPYKLLGYEYNCPTHIKDIKLLDKKLKSSVKIIHYHSNLSNAGLLNSVENSLADEAIEKINQAIKEDFNNSIFWSYRYATNPELGSGVGSRGDVADYKLKLLKNIGIIKDKSILDVGCGDLEIVKNLPLKDYTGIDISDEAVKKAKEKFPDFNFYNFEDERDKAKNADIVLCLDVLIHQPTFEKYSNLIEYITDKADKRVVVSGYEEREDNSHMCFFHENIKTSLKKTGCYKYVYKIGEYRGLGVYIGDKGNLIEQNTNNDLKNDLILDAIKIDDIDNDLLLEIITFSRANFGWYTKHYPRLYEYPWILKELGKNLKDLKIADFGAGVTPLPLLLSKRGAKVFTIDNHNIKRDLNNIDQVNEWGFFDYSILDNNITSSNKTLDSKTFEKESIDIWYSVSVIEHMPSKTRREICKIIADTLKNNGQLLLTLDLVKDSNLLWNMCQGQKVEDEKEHGTLGTFILELKSMGFIINHEQIFRMPKNERVDLAIISGVISK